jgi:hypothetical protein
MYSQHLSAGVKIPFSDLNIGFILKLHSFPGDIVKMTESGPKLYHIENNLVLASYAASSLYGMFLHAALTVCINLVDELEISELMSNLFFLDNSKFQILIS